MLGYYPRPEGVGYHPDFGQEVSYRFERLPESPDGQVRATMKKVLKYIRSDVDDPFVQFQTDKAKGLGGGDPILGSWQLLKGTLRFRQDEDIAQDLQIDDQRKDDVIEVLIRPADQGRLVLLRGMGVEDCDGFNLYGATILTAMGVPCAVVTVEADEDRPGLFSHVYTAAYPAGYHGERIPLDFSHGDYPGWEIPNVERRRRKEWRVEPTLMDQICDAAWPIGLLGAGYFGMHYLNRRTA